jgi:hypothetical protein
MGGLHIFQFEQSDVHNMGHWEVSDTSCLVGEGNLSVVNKTGDRQYTCSLQAMVNKTQIETLVMCKC